eukprot:573654-Rhodomonas_salina.3
MWKRWREPPLCQCRTARVQTAATGCVSTAPLQCALADRSTREVSAAQHTQQSQKTREVSAAQHTAHSKMAAYARSVPHIAQRMRRRRATSAASSVFDRSTACFSSRTCAICQHRTLYRKRSTAHCIAKAQENVFSSEWLSENKKSGSWSC